VKLVRSAWSVSRLTLSFCATLLLSQVTRANATIDLGPAAEKGDLATVQACLSKKANIETIVVRPIFSCVAVSYISFDLRDDGVFDSVLRKLLNG